MFILVLLVVLPLLFIILRVVKPSSSGKRPLPPGPKPWPIIGNILDMGTFPHVSLAKLSQVYGPLISVRLGSTLQVVACSPKAAHELLKTHDKLLSARYVPRATPLDHSTCDSSSLTFATKCTEHWKFLRTICRTELFSAKAIESKAVLREKKVNELLELLDSKQGKVVNIREVVFTTILNIVGKLVFSKDFAGWEDDTMASGIKGLVRKILKVGGAPNISDFYPILASLDLQGLRKEGAKYFRDMFSAWEVIVKERRESHSQQGGSTHRDFLDVFLENGMSDEQINIFSMELFVAGVDSSAVVLEWAMAEIFKNRGALEKLQEELNREINGHTIKESHVCELPYLNACIKETLRLHNPGPFPLPHRAPETLDIMGYTVPKNSIMLVNLWAIGRDPNIWEDPLCFKPERFLNSNMDFSGQHFEFLPFGSGRRMCPAFPMAARQLPLILASLVHHYQWSLPNNLDPMKLDMKEKFGLTLRRKNLLRAIPMRRHDLN